MDIQVLSMFYTETTIIVRFGIDTPEIDEKTFNLRMPIPKDIDTK